ncbi:MAG: hypothetical protein WDN31_05680 [Hyphomicrobium sp.]
MPANNMSQTPRRKHRRSAEKSWLPGQLGQGAEGLSKGYGGSEGEGTGASGPDDGKRLADVRRAFDAAHGKKTDAASAVGKKARKGSDERR